MTDLLRAEAAAIQLHRSGQPIIVGFTNWQGDAYPDGCMLASFSGGPLLEHKLVIEGPATRQQWDEQIRTLFGSHLTPRNPPPAPMQRFYRCRLERLLIPRTK